MPRVDLDSLEKQGRMTNSLQDALEVYGKIPALIRELRFARYVIEAAKAFADSLKPEIDDSGFVTAKIVHSYGLLDDIKYSLKKYYEVVK